LRIGPAAAAPYGVDMRTPFLVAATLVLSTLAGSARAQEFPLTDTTALVADGVPVDAAEFLGRKAVRIVKPEQGSEGAGFVPLRGVDFQDGTIEADVAVKITRTPADSMPGFIGIAFRTGPAAAAYDLFYVRPGLARADDQAARNHVAQYTAAPTYGWYELRRAWPWVYESHADLRLDGWTHMKIDVAGRVARLYLNGSTQPTLVVDGLKGEKLRGGVALFGFRGEEAYFSNVRVTAATPQPIANGSDAAGTWQVTLSTDAGPFEGRLQLQRQGGALSGTWSGALGADRPVTGTWRDGYVELRFIAQWPKEAGIGAPGDAAATLAGWIDGDAGKGRGSVDGRADGQWSATRTRPAPPAGASAATRSPGRGTRAAR
jgi:hypothetical protein